MDVSSGDLRLPLPRDDEFSGIFLLLLLLYLLHYVQWRRDEDDGR